MITRLTKEQFAAAYEALSMGSSFKTVAAMMMMSAEEFEHFIFNPAIQHGFEVFA